jgi:biotin operon repressor
MKIFDELFALQHIDQMIRTRATGSPKSLARRLDISECSTYRLIERLKGQGFPIEYDKKAQTYYYAEPVKWQFECVVGAEKLLSIKGGEKSLNIFPKLSIFDSEERDFCNAYLNHGAQ